MMVTKKKKIACFSYVKNAKNIYIYIRRKKKNYI